MTPVLALAMPGAFEWIVIAIVGLLLFGKRLPEVGRSLGKGIVEFKKGLKGIEDDAETSSTRKAELKSEVEAPKPIEHTPSA